MGKRKRRRTVNLLKFVIFVLVVLSISRIGVKYYFTNINRIDGKVRNEVTSFVQNHNGHFLTYDEIPEMYRSAVIATEDRSFFENIGIDFRGIIRAIYVDIKSKKLLQGGSTITQQLVDNTLLRNKEKSISWKLHEEIYAIGLYDTMSKEETFALYANVIYFGHGAYGLYQAAEIYFGKEPSQLNDGELTMLAGLPNAPSVYDPYKNKTLAVERQGHVVESLVDAKIINESEAERILNEPIVLKGASFK